MIMNKVGGGSSGGVTTRTVGLGEIYFNYTTSSLIANTRVISLSRNSGYAKFYFPGKVLKILSCKSRYSRSSWSYFEDVTSVTDNWQYFGNMAYNPYFSASTSSNYSELYAITELTAIIEDEASGGQVQTITISADDLNNGKRVKLPSNIISVSNLVSSATVPSGTDSKAALIKELRINGCLLYAKGSYAEIKLNVKLATAPGQGILMHTSSYYSSGGSANGIVFYPGFKPKYVAFSKVEDDYPGNGVISGNWHDASAPISFDYDSVIYADGNSTSGYNVWASSLSCEYTESTGESYLHFTGTSYGIYLSGTYQIVAIG